MAPGTREHPRKTLIHAGQAAGPGDEVIIAPGIYHEVLSVGGYPDATQPAVFRADPIGGAILRGDDTGEPGKRTIERCRVVVRRPHVRMIGLQVCDTSEQAMEFAESPGGLVDRCVLRDNQLDGVLSCRQDGSRVENCIAHDNGRYCIWFHEMQNGTAVSNTSAATPRAESGVSESPGVVIFSNLSAACGAGLHTIRASYATLRSDHNLFSTGVVASRADEQ
ncbi:MAG: hypothetical protein HPY69_07670 [Armatimonadetes bacterium]|nr:hypothetical protein [Armatimonadota bacterium]